MKPNTAKNNPSLSEAARREGACLQSTGPLRLSLVESLDQDPSLPSCLYSVHRGNDPKSHGAGGISGAQWRGSRYPQTTIFTDLGLCSEKPLKTQR